MIAKLCLQMLRDVACDQRRADLARLERRHLLVQCADDDAFLIGQHRAIDRAGNVILGEFRRSAHVDDFVKFAELC